MLIKSAPGRMVIKGNPTDVNKAVDAIANNTKIKAEKLNNSFSSSSRKLVCNGDSAKEISYIRESEISQKAHSCRAMSENATWNLCCNSKTDPLKRISARTEMQIGMLADKAKTYSPKRVLKAIEQGRFDFDTLRIKGLLNKFKSLL